MVINQRIWYVESEIVFQRKRLSVCPSVHPSVILMSFVYKKSVATNKYFFLQELSYLPPQRGCQVSTQFQFLIRAKLNFNEQSIFAIIHFKITLFWYQTLTYLYNNSCSSNLILVIFMLINNGSVISRLYWNNPNDCAG